MIRGKYFDICCSNNETDKIPAKKCLPQGRIVHQWVLHQPHLQIDRKSILGLKSDDSDKVG